ncbi:MAG TPA: acyl-CoA thioesterase [Desulfuromonadales bacterium]|nr:acyl-CoA thioesterase [Desulfuromonadales bacterium]
MRYHETPVTVRFNEVDAYRVAWHGHYVAWLETGRLGLTGLFGLDAFQLAELGYLGPVVNLEIKYLRPARFNDQLTVKTGLVPTDSATLIFESVIVDADGVKLASALTTHALTDLNGVLQFQLPAVIAKRLARMRSWLESP